MKRYNYRGFRLGRLNQPEYSHMKLLFFWPLFGLMFLLLERVFRFTYHPVACALDDVIPFCEYFVFPYYFWFAYIGWMLIYTFFFDIPAFRKFMWFIILTYSLTCVVYFVWPTSQGLRPEAFVRENFCTWIVERLYAFDTNTNVCPSLHVIGSMAVMFTARHSERYGTPLWRAVFTLLCLLICASTVFLKQHSIIDIAAALVLCFAVYPFVFLRKKKARSTPAFAE